MYDVITFGSATQDIYFRSKNFLTMSGSEFTSGSGVCFNLGSKIEAEDIFFSSGGGGTNAAATFSRQGFSVAYCGQLGMDYFGHVVEEELRMWDIGTDLIMQTDKKRTNVSVVLIFPGQRDRAILVYRGASDYLTKKDIPWKKLKDAKLFYMAPFSGKLAGLTEDLVDFARQRKIKVALNPGYDQLTLPAKKLERILEKVDIFILNQEEASLLTGISYKNEKEIFEKLDELVPGICVMTKGEKGVTVSDGEYHYEAGVLKTKVIDSTGAGDSFGSGFSAELLRTGNIVEAIKLASANSASNIRKFGAKDGILNKGQLFQKVKVNKEKII